MSLEISFEQLAQYKEYAMIADLEKVLLCDTVHVEFPELCVSATSKCIKTEYDVLTDRYKKIELGESKSNLAATIANQSAVLNSVNQTVYGNSGGYVMMHSTQNNDIPDEILIMDNYVIDEAKKGYLIRAAIKHITLKKNPTTMSQLQWTAKSMPISLRPVVWSQSK